MIVKKSIDELEPISDERLAELASLSDADIDTSDIPLTDFDNAHDQTLVLEKSDMAIEYNPTDRRGGEVDMNNNAMRRFVEGSDGIDAIEPRGLFGLLEVNESALRDYNTILNVCNNLVSKARELEDDIARYQWDEAEQSMHGLRMMLSEIEGVALPSSTDVGDETIDD